MKKIILLSLLVLVSVFVFAQRGGGDTETRIQKRVDHLNEQLNLSAAQQKKVKNLFASQQKMRKSDGKKWSDLSEAEREAKSAERKAAKADFDAKLAKILTPEQNETYKNMPKRHAKHASYRGKGKGKYKGTRDGVKKTSGERTQSRVAKMTEQLGLSATQQTQLTELMASKHQNRKKGGKAFEDMSEADRATMKAEHKAASEAYRTQFEKILTPEQLATYQKLKAERKEKGKKDWGNNKRGSKK